MRVCCADRMEYWAFVGGEVLGILSGEIGKKARC